MHYSIRVASGILEFEKETTSKNDYLLSRIDNNRFKFIDFSLMSLETLLVRSIIFRTFYNLISKYLFVIINKGTKSLVILKWNLTLLLINLSNPLGFSQNILPSPWATNSSKFSSILRTKNSGNLRKDYQINY